MSIRGIFGCYQPGLVSQAVINPATGGGGTTTEATGTADPNTLGLSADILSYIQTDPSTGALVQVWYRNPISGNFE